jgi:hypothetical protein
MYYIGDTIRTSNRVSKKDYEKLKTNNIKPGSIGEVVDIIYVVKFDNTILELQENSLDCFTEEKVNAYDPSVEYLKNMFGMK